MTLKDILKQLEAKGDAKVRARYQKTDAKAPCYGVKLGDLRVIAKQLKANHALALELWATGNIDAQLVATLVMKPTELSAAEMEAMVKAGSSAQVADWLHSYVLKEHPSKEALRVKWMEKGKSYAARAGWRLTAERIAKTKEEGLDLVALLDRIEAEMAQAKPEVQWTMNHCLATIGIHVPKLRKRALAIGEALGIYRDYPVSKGCTSPFAPIWINEMVKRQG